MGQRLCRALGALSNLPASDRAFQLGPLAVAKQGGGELAQPLVAQVAVQSAVPKLVDQIRPSLG
jgi:hypothetical protein